MSLLIFLSMLLIISGVAAQEDQVKFIQPPEQGGKDYSKNPTYTLNSQLDLQWDTQQPSYVVYLSQIDAKTKSLSLGPLVFSRNSTKAPAATSQTQKVDWTVSNLSFDLHDSNVFCFTWAINEDLEGATVSHAFNISTTSVPSQASFTRSSSDGEPTEDLTFRQTQTLAQTKSVSSTLSATDVSSTSTSIASVRASKAAAQSSPAALSSSGSKPASLSSSAVLSTQVILVGDTPMTMTMTVSDTQAAATATATATTDAATSTDDISSMAFATPSYGNSTVTETLTVTRMFYTTTSSNTAAATSTATSSPLINAASEISLGTWRNLNLVMIANLVLPALLHII